MVSTPLPRAFACSRSLATGCSPPRNRAPWCMRSMLRARASRSPRSSPTRATTLSCSRNRNCSPSCAGSSTAPARHADWRVALRRRVDAMSPRADSNLTVANIPRTPGGARVDLVLMAEMVERGAKVLDVGCGDGELLRLLGETRDVDGRGIELSREGVNECVAKGLAVVQGDADTDLANYPDDAFDFVILSRPLEDTAAGRARRPHAADRQSALCVVGNAEHPLLQHQGFPRALPCRRRQD